MDFLHNVIINNLNTFFGNYILIILLVFCGVFFTIKSNFVQFKYLKEMFRLLGDSNSTKKGSVSSFQAFCISTASRVGTGNLAGVATAVAIGGPGAVFWMWVIALIGASSSFIESTLAQIYKVKDGNAFRGGPSYYIEKGLKNRKLGIFFSILTIVCFGLIFNSVQSNTLTLAFNEAFGIDKVLISVILTIVTLLVIFGGVHRVAKVSSLIVPIMAVAYILVVLFVVITNFKQIPYIFSMILENAFGFNQVVGGSIGAALLQGIKRGLFSNEAGMGSAPNAAATADVTHPVKQGFIQALGVFTDTILICSCTAFLILFSGAPIDGSVRGIQLTQIAMTNVVGSWGSSFIAICILMFAFSSIVGNYYYGETNIQFISQKKIYLTLYRLACGAMVFFGSLASMNFVWDLADLFMAFMAIINLIVILLLSKIAFKALDDYTKQKKSGIKDPIFNKDCIDNLDDSITEW